MGEGTGYVIELLGATLKEERDAHAVTRTNLAEAMNRIRELEADQRESTTG
jgi:hypothetical protein